MLTDRFLKDLGDSGDDFMGRAFMPISVCDNMLSHNMYVLSCKLNFVYIRIRTYVIAMAGTPSSDYKSTDGFIWSDILYMGFMLINQTLGSSLVIYIHTYVCI